MQKKLAFLIILPFNHFRYPIPLIIQLIAFKFIK